MKYLKNMTNKKVLNIFTLCILIFVPFLQVLSFYLQLYGVLKYYSSINSSMVMWFCIPFLIYVYVKDIIDKKRKLDVYDYILYFLVIIGIIISLLAIDFKTSIFGIEYRREGLLSLISYYLLFINWKVNGTSHDIKKYTKVFLIIGVINAIYSLLQIYTNFSFIFRYEDDIHMASGLSGNPNFFGSLMVTLLGIIISKFLMEKELCKKDILLTFLFLLSLINCQSTGPILTYFIFLIFIIILLRLKGKLFYRKIIVLFLITLFTFLGVSHANKSVENERCELCDFNETVNTGGNGRIEIWQKTLDIIKKHPIVGIGYDNFEFAYPNSKPKIKFYIENGKLEIKEEAGYVVDNAHNVYLHILAVSGILGLLPYLILCLYTFIHGLKSNNKIVIILLGGFAAYSIQAFGNISVIDVAPIYYIIIGLILSEKLNKDKALT